MKDSSRYYDDEQLVAEEYFVPLKGGNIPNPQNQNLVQIRSRSQHYPITYSSCHDNDEMDETDPSTDSTASLSISSSSTESSVTARSIITPSTTVAAIESSPLLLIPYRQQLNSQYCELNTVNEKNPTDGCFGSSNTAKVMTSWDDWIFCRVFGFHNHPFRSLDGDLGTKPSRRTGEGDVIKSARTASSTNIQRNSKASDMRLAMLSNFSTSYNIVAISLALSILENVYPSQTTVESKSLCSSTLLAGMIIGQLVGGVIGDILGRHSAMAVVMALQVIGAIMSALSFEIVMLWDSEEGDTKDNSITISIYVVLATWRFILGLGCGGVYPLAATITAESAPSSSTTSSSSSSSADNIMEDSDYLVGKSNDKTDASKSVALSFSMQGVGYLVGPTVGWLLLTFLNEHSDLSWRLLLGFGAIPGLILMILRLERQLVMNSFQDTTKDGMQLISTETSSADLGSVPTVVGTREIPVSVWDAILLEEDVIRKLLGTAGCWFVFDVLFYGNVLFQPVVLSAAFGPDETLKVTAMHTVVVSLLALPGYFASVVMIGRQTPRYIQMQGFLLMGLLYSIIGTFFHDLANHKPLMVTLYGSTFFFSNYGPNATTFLLPSVTFSTTCRATLNGFSAACGKIGALLGATIFVAAASRFGEQAVMIACASLSFVGAVITMTCVSEMVLHKQIENESRQTTAAKKHLPMRIIISEPSLVDYYDSV